MSSCRSIFPVAFHIFSVKCAESKNLLLLLSYEFNKTDNISRSAPLFTFTQIVLCTAAKTYLIILFDFIYFELQQQHTSHIIYQNLF